jgi:cobalamin synthase
MSRNSLESNKSVQILKDAEEGRYGVIAPVIYNVSSFFVSISIQHDNVTRKLVLMIVLTPYN